jgi:hypothetical protein
MKLFKSVLKISGIVVAVALTACVHGPYYDGPPHPVPPPHFYPYDYYYYPSVRIYYQISTGFYYYPSGRKWIRAKVLPPHFHLDPRDRVHLKIEKGEPYEKHRVHREKYKSRRDLHTEPRMDKQERERNLKSYQQSHEQPRGRKEKSDRDDREKKRKHEKSRN